MPAVVSVVIPCYKQAHFLDDAIGSVLAQTHSRIDLIVVNDGSPDVEALEHVVAQNRDMLTYVSQENRGLAAARNTGLQQAQGEFVVFLDSDDRLIPDGIARGVAALTARPDCGLAWGFRRLIDYNGKVTRDRVGLVCAQPTYAELLETNIIGPPVGVIFRRSALLDVGGFRSELRFAEDYDTYLRMAQRSSIVGHEYVVGDYRLHDHNMSSNFRGMFAAINQILDRQRAAIGNDPVLTAALARGRSDARERYHWSPRLEELRRDVRHGKLRAVAGAATLLLMHPLRFTGTVLRYAAKVAGRMLPNR